MPTDPLAIPPNPALAPKELLQRYATAGPRYTSYPTAPHFTPDLDWDELQRRWKSGNEEQPQRGLSFYVHIPFCRERCFFCGCFTHISSRPESADPYLDSLLREFELVAQTLDPSRPVLQLSLGGGTPTFLTPERFERMMLCMKEIWHFGEGAEISVEIDPRTVTEEHVDVLVQQGFNRFSMGVQDFDPRVLDIIHRKQSLEHTQALVTALRSRGRQAVNFDLIYGLPGQTPETMQATAEQTVQLSPSRIALYSYAHVPWMKSNQKVLEKHPIPGPDEKLALFGIAYDIFTQAGYIPVGMDHFARPEDELCLALAKGSLHRNFMGYTTRRGLDLAGFGVSAISSVSRTYAQNSKNFEGYHKAMQKGRPAFERGYLLSEQDDLRRELIIDLFCNFELDGHAFGQRWGIDFNQAFADELERLVPMQQDGLLTLDGERIQVSPLGRAFIRNICMVFDAYLEQDLTQRRYSQTV